MSKVLIAYFSRKGENYVNGSIENLPVGNTEVAAKKIQALTGGELYEIRTTRTYSADYTECTNEAKQELREGARPDLVGPMPAMDTYDSIYLGFPNWWGTCPMAVFTFLDGIDTGGRRILPFCTHEGSGMGSSERDLRKVCPSADVMSGLAIQGGRVNQADSAIERWINGEQ